MSWVQQPAIPFQQQLQPPPQAQPNSGTEPPTADMHSKSAAPVNKMRPQTQTYASNAFPANVPPQQPHPQINFGNQQHPLQQTWQQQQAIHSQPSQVMQSGAGNGKDWHLRQQQQSQPNNDNANMYQQYVPTAANNWQQPEVTAPSVPHQPQAPLAAYPNYYNQPAQAAVQPAHQPKPANYNHNNAANFFQPQQPQQPTDFFDNSVVGNNTKTDGWGDWDWNDNTNSNAVANQQHQPQQLQDNFNSNSAIDESFSSEKWHWSGLKDVNTNVVPPVHRETTLPHQQSNAHAEQQPSFPPTEVPLLPTHGVDVNNVVAKPKTLSLPEPTNDNYNIAASAPMPNASSVSSPSNIPNSVYVSQAKPVARPSRQYASPPGGSTPADAPSESALIPPQAFQNEPPKIDSARLTPGVLPPPAAAVPTLSTIAPPPRAADNTAGNPFKRTGVAQHHRAAVISATPTATSTIPTELPPLVPTATTFVVATPPPPPADFANPISIEAENSEILHENQEVLSQTTLPASIQPVPTPMHYGVAMNERNQHIQTNSNLSENPETSAMNAQTASLVGIQSALTPMHLPPLIDERNRYMQTSQLSENPDEEIIVESDNLPPPGLSRLVLGQPEAEASQRMVTGTEQPPNTVSTNMHIEERHADGEDTSEELPLPTTLMSPLQRGVVVSGANIGASNNAVPNIGLTTDRNLYLVPGESNAVNEPRVVTGVERMQEPIVINTSPIINTQRELELDGENLEDQQAIAVINRNEPPLEGAVSNSELTVLPVAPEPADHHQHHHQSKTKDAASTESDHVPEHHGRYGNKSRKHGENVSKTEKLRKDKRRSAKHTDSEETEEEYSSDREHGTHRNYREGSARSERGRDEREFKEKRHRDRHDSSGGGEREKLRDKYYYRDRHENSKTERRGKHYNRHDNDTEESSRLDQSRREKTRAIGRGGPSDERGGRSDRSDRDYDDRHYYKRDSGRERAERDRRVDEERDRRERDRRHRHREREDYDTIERRWREKHRERGGDPRDYEEYRKPSSRNDGDKDRRRPGEQRYDNWYGYPSGTYDPYTYYYEQMARTNPQAYSEWYKKYYSAAAMGGHSSVGAADQLTNSSLAATDGRESVHSGRSSAHNEKDRYTHAYISQANEYHQRHYEYHYHQQQQQQLMSHSHMSFNSTMLEEPNGSQYGGIGRARSTSNLSHTHSTTSAAMTGLAYYGGAQRAYYARSEFADSRSGNLSVRDTDPSVPDPQRLTPCKFANEHSVVSLSAGIIVTVKPKYTSHGSISNVVKIKRLGVNDSTRQLFQAFPGPLIRGQTHKKTIIEFCEEQIRAGPTQTTIFAKQLVTTNLEKYRASYTLMWNLLILLLRQNGMVVGTDIAELLLKNQQQFPYIWQPSNRHTSQSESDSQADSVDESNSNNADAEQEQESNEHSKADGVDSLASATKSLTVTETDVTEKFRNYLLYGNVNEALDWATENNLWGHALFLASKMDRRSHANVMMKFANKLALNDPLQTLYQLMSGRTPSSVTSVQDERWGDWRPHLSMILSNTSQKPDLDRKAITTLGDSLFNRGDLFAAHFCYLMAQVGFGRYQQSAVQETALQQYLPKLVLLGSSHYKSFNEFATNEAIIMTEIYEYACSLNDEKFSLIEFQPYKYLLATRLLDYGYPLRSLMYTEQIALHMQRDTAKYESSFIQKIYVLADRLKYYDPVLEKAVDEQQQSGDERFSNNQYNFEEQKWLQDLRSIADQYKVADSEIQQHNSEANYTLQNHIDQQFAEINQKFSELNMQYAGAGSDGTFYQEQHQHQQHQHQQEQPTANDLVSYSQSQPPSLQPTAAAEYNHERQQQSYGLPNVGGEAVSQQPSDLGAEAYANYSVATQQQYMQPDLQLQQASQNNYYDPTQQQQHQYNPNNTMGVPNAAGGSGNYDYWAAQQAVDQHHASDETGRPTISLPKSKTYDSDDDTRRPQKLLQKNDVRGQQLGSIGADKDNSKSSQQGSQNSGWFGGIWNKLSLKPKNQMILPDDKNPSIVWDADKKRWVNTDGETATEENLKPPPKMSDIVQQTQAAHLAQQQQGLTQQQQQLPQQQQQLPQQQQQLPQQQQQLPPQQHQQMQQPPQPAFSSMETQQYPGVAPSPPASIPLAAPVPGVPMQNYSASSASAAAALPTDNATTKTPILQSNMFKMQRNRTLKNSYVDVFNPSGAPMNKAAENVLAPALPPAAVPQGGFFIPGAPAPTNDASLYPQQQQLQQQQQPVMSQEVPQFYNPNQYGAGGPTY